MRDALADGSTAEDASDVTGVAVRLSSVSASYGPRVVVDDLSLSVRRGECLGLVGHNGAGKSSLLRAIAGVLPLRGGRIDFPSVPGGRQSQLIVMIPSEHYVFPRMSVADHLLLPDSIAGSTRTLLPVEEVHALFPGLAGVQTKLAGTLSGGQQRMLSIGMALRCIPEVLLLDEPSAGVARAVAVAAMEAIAAAQSRWHIAVIVSEQNLDMVMRFAQELVVLRGGRKAWEGHPSDIPDARELWRYY